MNDDSLERLLRGYEPPETSRSLDQRVLAPAARILARARMRAAAIGMAREFANAFGFGFVNCLIDLLTAADAEYSVELI